PTDTAAYSAPEWCSLSDTSGQNGYGRCSASSAGLSPPQRACHPRQYGSSSDGCTRYPPAAPASLAAYPHLRDWPPSEHPGPVPEKNNPDTGRGRLSLRIPFRRLSRKRRDQSRSSQSYSDSSYYRVLLTPLA